jgi:subtilase family serine protease
LAVTLLVGLAACTSPQGVAPLGAPASSGVTLAPDHGASSLPGGWLPCGYPTGGSDDALHYGIAGTLAPREASCSVAIGTSTAPLLDSAVPNDDAIVGLHPEQLDRAYGFPSRGSGMTVAIVDAFDDPHVESDLATYRSRFHLPPCTTANGCFRKVNQEGTLGPYPRVSDAWSREIALDVEMVSAVCPRCPIVLIEANSASIDDLGASVDEAVALGAKSVSNSYYAVEWAGETSEDAHYTHPGVAITVSSGDVRVANDGGGNGGDALNKRAEPYYPASSPYVTAIGGTTLVPRGAAFREAPWGNAADGCSRFEPRPAFQGPVCSKRSSVDMAVVGDPRTGVSVYVTQAGGWVVAGGTSVGAAVIAAAYALSGNPAGPAFSYAHAGHFRHLGRRLDTGLGAPIGIAGL